MVAIAIIVITVIILGVGVNENNFLTLISIWKLILNHLETEQFFSTYFVWVGKMYFLEEFLMFCDPTKMLKAWSQKHSISILGSLIWAVRAGVEDPWQFIAFFGCLGNQSHLENSHTRTWPHWDSGTILPTPPWWIFKGSLRQLRLYSAE